MFLSITSYSASTVFRHSSIKKEGYNDAAIEGQYPSSTKRSSYFMAEMAKSQLLPYRDVYGSSTCPQSEWRPAVSSSFSSQRSHSSLSSASTSSGCSYRSLSTIHPGYNEPDVVPCLDEYALSDQAIAEKSLQPIQSHPPSRWHSRASACSSASSSLTSLSSIDPS